MIPLQLTFRQIDRSAALETRIRKLAARLGRFSQHILRCHLVIERRSRRARQGALYDIHLHIALPGQEVSVTHSHIADAGHEDPYVALTDAFRTARRRLEDYERRRRLAVKTHAEPAQGHICEIDSARDSGRIETDDGRLVYFHRNSVLGRRFQDLKRGARVRFAEEAGDLGPQATTVHVLS